MQRHQQQQLKSELQQQHQNQNRTIRHCGCGAAVVGGVGRASWMVWRVQLLGVRRQKTSATTIIISRSNVQTHPHTHTHSEFSRDKSKKLLWVGNGIQMTIVHGKSTNARKCKRVIRYVFELIWGGVRRLARVSEWVCGHYYYSMNLAWKKLMFYN